MTRHGRARQVSGMTFLELLAAVSVLLIVATAVMPTARTVHRRLREQQLQQGLGRIRKALDDYHSDWEQGYIKSDSKTGWPPDLDTLTKETEYAPPVGMLPPGSTFPPPTTGNAGGFRNTHHGSLVPGKKTKIYLAHLPKDPFNKEDEPWDVSGWMARGYADDPKSESWNGEDVYDVRSSSQLEALDGTFYKDW